jgi:hypothetical protein
LHPGIVYLPYNPGSQDLQQDRPRGSGGVVDEPEVELTSVPTLPITVPSTSIGEPQDLGESLLGVTVGYGSPNIFYVGGYTPEEAGDRLFLAGVGATLTYHTRYDIEFFENGAILNIRESYSLTRNTIYTSIESAGSILNVATAEGITHRVLLGQFDAGYEQRRTTDIVIYGSYPVDMQITVVLNLSDALVASAPLPVYEFYTNPSDIAP